MGMPYFVYVTSFTSSQSCFAGFSLNCKISFDFGSTTATPRSSTDTPSPRLQYSSKLPSPFRLKKFVTPLTSNVL